MTVDTTKKRGRVQTRSRPPASKPTSLRAYAKLRGVSVAAVSKAIKTGRLKKSVVDVKGIPQIADVTLADREWAANTDLSRAHDAVKARASEHGRSQATKPAAVRTAAERPGVSPGEAPAAAGAATEAPGRETDRGRVLTLFEPQSHGGQLKREVEIPDDSIAAASAKEKHWRAKKAELDYKRAAAELVNAHDIQARLVDVFTTCRSKLLGLPTKAKSQLPHLTLADIAILDGIVREALDELALEKVAV